MKKKNHKPDTKYIVHQRYYDSGRVEAWLEILHSQNTTSAYQEHYREWEGYDYYTDVFASFSEAKTFLEICRSI